MTSDGTPRDVDSSREEIGPDAKNLYELMWGRRQHFEALLWQTPVVLFTAQAFLLTIALAGDTKQAGRIIASLLLVAISVVSALLFQKHRALEQKSSQWLEDRESKSGAGEPARIHGRGGHAARKATEPWILGWSLSAIWAALLWGAAVLSILVMGFALFASGALTN